MLKISFTDFWDGFDNNNNLIINILKDIFNPQIVITSPRNADVCFVTICGKNHKKILKKYREKCILFLGENIRPNNYNVPFSLSSDFNTYDGKNARLPLWYLEIDWYKTNIVAKSKLHNFLKDCKFLKKYLRISTPEIYGNKKEFLKGAEIAYETILTSFANGDLIKLKSLLSPNMFSNFSDAIKA